MGRRVLSGSQSRSPIDQTATSQAVFSIRFIDDRPAPAIVLHLDAIARLASDAARLRPGHPESLPLFRNLILGRALGRALAHEIGHFLLRSRQHSETGLMQAAQPVFRLIGRDPRGFVLSSDDVMRLMSVTSSALNHRAEGDRAPVVRPTPHDFLADDTLSGWIPVSSCLLTAA